MSYTAFYRKLRPVTLCGIVGQEHITKTLRNQLTHNRISHAYLFCGTRGTGKTSTAKVFAKAVNCLTPEDGEPCDTCEVCRTIASNRSLSVIEIDAASNNGVENIRDIREEVKYPPTDCRFKVYIIDEVHMLSTGAFNALLKTLEEPPEHAIFILATTDPQKIPVTILSRVQRFDFKRISVRDIVALIRQYIEAGEIAAAIEDDALLYIAQISDGAMRDALSILDQCVAFYFDKTITLADVLELVGSVDGRMFYELTEELARYDSVACIRLIDDLVAQGRDIGQFVAELIVHIRNLLVCLSVGLESDVLDLSVESRERLWEQAQTIGRDRLLHYIQVFSAIQNQIKYSSSERIILEVACIKICNPSEQRGQEGADLATLMRIQKLEERLESGVIQEPPKKSVEKKQEPVLEKPVPEDFLAIKKDWPNFAKQFQAPLRFYLENSKVEYLEGNTIYIVTTDSSKIDHIKKNESLLKKELEAKYQKDFPIRIMLREMFEANHQIKYGAASDELVEIASFTELINTDIMFENDTTTQR